MNIKSLIPYIVKEKIHAWYWRQISIFFPKHIADKLHKKLFGYKINWKNPVSINEKINWLKFNSDTSLWPLCADKYKVRKFIEDRGLAHTLTKLYGFYTNANDINFDKLPKKFVLKCNHGSGDVLIVRDKDKIDIEKIRLKFNSAISHKFDAKRVEHHYYKIKPLIICEELLETENTDSETSITDYKIWCFNGKAHSIMVLENRTSESLDMSVFDLDWQPIEYAVCESEHYKKPKRYIDRPPNLDEMIKISEILSKGFEQVRVDLYNINSKIYFGELTFTSAGGFMTYYSQRFLNELGDQIQLPN